MKLKIVTAALFSTYIGLQAQTTNQGMLYVGENTQFSTLEDLDNRPVGSFINDGDTFIYKGFNNDGIVDFYDITGTTRFLGNSNQLISGQEFSNFYNIYFNNDSSAYPFQLSGAINAFGAVDFFQGIVDIDNFNGSFAFIDTANHVNTSNFSYADGNVIKQGTQSFIYPIGDAGYYRFAAISESVTENTHQTKYYLENSNSLYNHNLRPDSIMLINNAEYWTISAITGTEAVMVTLSWNDDTTPQEIIQQPLQNNIHIVRWDEDLDMWMDEGGLVDEGNQTVTAAVEKFGIFTLARVNSNQLPCDITIYNTITPNGDGVNDYFRIDKVNNSCNVDFNLDVKIFNRWGVKVYESNNYGKGGNNFEGISNGRATIQKDRKLPTGTYFYILDYQFESGSGQEVYSKSGYLYIN